jgi:pimeloyl-ACP methyl ester carboxylesterase
MFNRKSLLVAGVLVFACFCIAPGLNAQIAGREVQSTDYMVPHVSTVPAIKGKRVELFVREKVQVRRPGDPDVIFRPIVLMIHGNGNPSLPVFDLQFQDYSWMDYLANAGFDVFAMDLTGYGLSPRPMMDDPCNAAKSEQQKSLIPKPLAATCPPSYPFQLTTIQSDWDDIDRVVDYIRKIRNVDKVNLLAWSRGGPRAGGYAGLHPEKVDKLFLYAPVYVRDSPDNPPPVLPQPGVPYSAVGFADFHANWDGQQGCQNQFTPQIRPVINSAILDSDLLGSTWGTAGVRRGPIWNNPPGYSAQAIYGWNPKLAAKITAPTLIIRGELDTQVPAIQSSDLMVDLVSVPQLVFIQVACSSHFMVWENQHMILMKASEEWIRHGTFKRQLNGFFNVDTSGFVHRAQ